MPFHLSLSQSTFATAVLASTAGCIVGLKPPNPSPPNHVGLPPSSTLSRLRHFITEGNLNDLILAPITFLSLHTVGLALADPPIPRWLLGVTTTHLNPRRISWSTDTAVPLAALLCVGIPLRLVAYQTLGDSFTFKLATPKKGLVTTGIYQYLQHPSYTGAAIIFVAPMVLWYRADGAMGCWLPERAAKVVEKIVAPVLAAVLLSLMGLRVKDEERMLRDRFGQEWEQWSQRTARFVPWLC